MNSQYTWKGILQYNTDISYDKRFISFYFSFGISKIMYITVPVIHQIFLHSTTKYSQIHPLKVEESLLLSNEAQ